MDKFARMSAFVETVSQGGFAAAARRLNVSRSAVSKSIQALEAELGIQLLQRTTRVVSPTAAGLAYFERAKAILTEVADVDASISGSQGAPRGLLRVNAPMSFGTLHLADAVIDFMAEYRDISIQLTLNDRLVDPIEDGHDITIRIANLTDSSLIARKITATQMVLCASPRYLKANKEPRTTADLAQHACLHYGLSATGTQWKLKGQRALESVTVRYRLCSNNGEVLRAAAIKGAGIALLPAFIVGADIQAGRLKAVLTDYELDPLTISGLYAPSRHLSTSVRVFLDFLVRRFGDRPTWTLHSKTPPRSGGRGGVRAGKLQSVTLRRVRRLPMAQMRSSSRSATRSDRDRLASSDGDLPDSPCSHCWRSCVARGSTRRDRRCRS